jgi:glycosyltransferase involved in cell wall biosynthesis
MPAGVNRKRIEGMVSILMPAFNESENISSNLREVVDTFREFADSFEVILIDDGSGDDTYLHAARVLRDHPEFVRVVRYDKNEGKGNALVAGAAYVKGDYVVFLDADMDLHPNQLPVFFEIMEARNADAVIGSKWHPASDVSYPSLRRVYSLGYFLMVRVLFGLPLRDTQTGLKLFRTALIADVIPRVLSKRFAYDIEILAVAHRRGYRIVDAPVRLEFRRTLGRLKLPAVWRTFLDTLAVFYRMHFLHYYDRPLEKLPERPRGNDSRELRPDDVSLEPAGSEAVETRR